MTEFALYGLDLFGEPIKPPSSGILADNFIVPPFSVLDTKQGYWQERKQAWLAMGIKGEVGRGERLTWVKGNRDYDSLDPVSQKILAATQNGTSIFDPVLCEICYRWFCPPNGQILDPFAGGSVRGIVAGVLGYKYCGIDLSERQIEANEIQRQSIAPDTDLKWIVGDSGLLLAEAPDADFIFSCPPYGDLEVYSDDPADISTMEYPDFMIAYKKIIRLSCDKLKNNRFACFVVGDFRDKKTGLYRGFVLDTINAFRECGLGLYNEAILSTAIGSLGLCVSASFPISRKLGKAHQNVLTFIKGDWRQAVKDLY